MNSNQLAPIDNDHGELDVATPDGSDNIQDATGFAGELTTSSGKSRAINTTAVVMGIIVAAAAVGIWSMRWVSDARASSDDPSEWETTVRTALPLIRKQTGEGDENSGVLLVMRDDPTALQVPINEVQKNPFEIPGIDDATEVEDIEITTTATVDPEQIRRERRQTIEAAGERIKVSSIISGSSPVALLDGEVFRVGDIVDAQDWAFVIEAIDSNGVTLVFEDQFLRSPVRVIAKIDSGESGSRPRRPSRPRR